MEIAWCLLAGILGLLLGVGGARLIDRMRLSKTQVRMNELTEQANQRAENIVKEAELHAKDEVFKKREEFNREMETGRGELREQERRLDKREDTIEQKHKEAIKKERMLENLQRKVGERRSEVEKRGKEAEEIVAKQGQLLHEISTLSRDQAETMLLERIERQLTSEIAGRLQKHEEALKAQCEEKSREIVVSAIQRYAAEHTADTTVSTVDIPSDDMKGRIIGREGRKSRTFGK